MTKAIAGIAGAFIVLLLMCTGGLGALLGAATPAAADCTTAPNNTPASHPGEPSANATTASPHTTQTAAGDSCATTDLPAGFALPPDTPAAIVTTIGWALQQLGTPYHLDGDCTAAHSGNPTHQCDCSSLVQQAYNAAGITLPRTADAQSHHGQLITDPVDLHPGDLIFIPGSDGTRTHPGHVGMYLGEGLVIEAPHSGQNVKIVPYKGDWITQRVAIRREFGTVRPPSAAPARSPTPSSPNTTSTVATPAPTSPRSA